MLFTISSGHPVKPEASELVPGDIIILEAGDVVPADARLVQVSSFQTEGPYHNLQQNLLPPHCGGPEG